MMNDTERKGIVTLATDLMKGVTRNTYSLDRNEESLRQALLDANGGTYEFNRKNMRRNGVEIFEILEELIPVIKRNGLEGNEFFMKLVDRRYVAEGDRNEFYTKEKPIYLVSEIADGIASHRRQRVGAMSSTSITTSWHGITLYDEFSRFMANRIDWSDLVTAVGTAMVNYSLDKCYNLFNGISAATNGLSSNFVTSGTYDEDDLLALVERVEYENEAPAAIYGTKAALRKCTEAAISDSAKESYHEMGYYGKLAGVPMVAVPDRYNRNASTWAFGPSTLWVLAGDAKPIKHIDEGEAYIEEDTTGRTADKSIGYTYQEKTGYGLIVSEKLGKYTIS